MKLNIKNLACGIFLVIGLYLIYTLFNPVAVKPIAIRNAINANTINANTINATAYANANVNRNQSNPLDIDRPPLIEENPTIITANEIYMDNYKDYTINQPGTNELYTNDNLLFNEKNNGNFVPLDLNDGTHRRVNFY